MGHGRAGGEDPPWRADGRRHLRRHRRARPARPRRGVAHDRQHRWRAADRLHRGDDHAHAVPLRRLGVRDQRLAVPPAGHSGPALRLRPWPRDARHRWSGAARRRAARDPRGAPPLHRGGRRHPQAPPPQGQGAAQARRDAGQPHAHPGPHGGDSPPAGPARAPGRGRPPGADHPDRGSGCSLPPSRGRYRAAIRRSGTGARRRDGPSRAARGR